MDRLLDEVAALRERLRSDRPSASAAAAARFGLTKRELDVLRLMAKGLSNLEIARELSITTRGGNNIYHKLGVKRRADAATLAVRVGLLPGVADPAP